MRKRSGRWAGFFCGVILLGTIGQVSARAQHHPRYPNAPVNDPQLLLPTDQAPSCFNPRPSGGGYDQFETFDVYAQPASKGYLCIAVPEGRTFVIDTLFAEADYDSETSAPPEWYLDTTVGHYEQLTGFAAVHAGSLTQRPHYLLNQSVHIPVTGGTTVTLIMHNFSVGQSQQISETPGTASLSLIGHWE